MENNNIQIKTEFSEYLDIDITDDSHGENYDDIENAQVEVEWTAHIEEVYSGIELAVYSIDKIYFKYDIIKWTDDDGDQMVETVDIEIVNPDNKEWTIEYDINSDEDKVLLILTGISINKDKKTIDLQFN